LNLSLDERILKAIADALGPFAEERHEVLQELRDISATLKTMAGVPAPAPGAPGVRVEALAAPQVSAPTLELIMRELTEPVVFPDDVRHLPASGSTPVAFAAGVPQDLWVPNSARYVLLRRLSLSVDAATTVGLLWDQQEFDSYILLANSSFIVNMIGCNIKGPKGARLRLSSSAAANITASAWGKET